MTTDWQLALARLEELLSSPAPTLRASGITRLDMELPALEAANEQVATLCRRLDDTDASSCALQTQIDAARAGEKGSSQRRDAALTSTIERLEDLVCDIDTEIDAMRAVVVYSGDLFAELDSVDNDATSVSACDADKLVTAAREAWRVWEDEGRALWEALQMTVDSKLADIRERGERRKGVSENVIKKQARCESERI